MELAARTGAWSGKPLPYLRRVAWLATDHSEQWIDLGFKGNADIDFEVKFQSTMSSISFQSILGDRYSASSSRFSLMLGSERAYDVYINAGNSNEADLIGGEFYLKGDAHIARKEGTSCFVDSVLIGNLMDQAFETPFNLVLFGTRTNGVFSNNFTGKIYFANVGDLMLIPVLDLSGRPAMYDEVSGQLFYNQGTGEFTWGELDAASAPVSSRGGGTKCLTPRRSYRRLARPSARFCSHSQEWEVAA